MLLTPSRDCLTIALKLVSLGYSTVPSGSGPKGKFPLIKWKEFQNRLPTSTELAYWQYSMHPRLWGVITGKISGIVVIDIDDNQARLILEKEGLTPHILTPRCANFWFRHPGYFIKTVAGILPAIDIRGDKGFVNVTGIRRDGGTYRIAKWPIPDNIYPWECLPTSISEAIQEKERPQLQPTPFYTRVENEDVITTNSGGKQFIEGFLLHRALENATDGTRNQEGFWLGCQLRDNGFSKSRAEQVMSEYVLQVCSLDPEDPYTEREALRSLEQAYSRPPRKELKIDNPRHNKRYTHV